MDQPKVNKSLSSEAVQAIAKALTMAEVGRGRTLLTRSEKAAPAQYGCVRSQLVKGPSCSCITRFARRHGCYVIVMGCRGFTELRSFCLGCLTASAHACNSPLSLHNVVTYDVVITVDNHDLDLKPGMIAIGAIPFPAD